MDGTSFVAGSDRCLGRQIRAIVNDGQLIANVTATILLNNEASSDYPMLPDNPAPPRTGIWKVDFRGIDPGSVVKLTVKAQNVSGLTTMVVENFSCP